jgi:integrase
MRLKDHPEKDGMRVWLDERETQLLIEEAQNTEQRVAFHLMTRSGLRRNEMLQIKPRDLAETDTGHHVRVRAEYSKSDHHREPPVSQACVHHIQNLADDLEPDENLVDRDPKTIYNWVSRAAERCAAAEDEPGWQYVSPHDLRRTWGTQLLEAGVLPSVVMAWGGWQDWETFRDHYLGEFSPEAIRRERNKVEYLADRSARPPAESRSGYSAHEPHSRDGRNTPADRY